MKSSRMEVSKALTTVYFTTEKTDDQKVGNPLKVRRPFTLQMPQFAACKL
jgi:hypothetical protein